AADRADDRRRGAAPRLLAGRPGRPLPGRDGLRRRGAPDPPGRDRVCRGPRGRCVRAQALRDPPGGRAHRRPGPRGAEPLLADARLQGDAHGPAARALLPRPRRPAARDGARARPLPLLDEHLPELRVLAGRSLPHALMMMIPESYEGREDMSPELRGFYAFHQCLLEAWDGPAAISFTDGRVIGATLDRNGLRPGRWYETSDGWVVLASEAGVLPDAGIVRKGRLQPGKLFLVDLEQ